MAGVLANISEREYILPPYRLNFKMKRDGSFIILNIYRRERIRYNKEKAHDYRKETGSAEERMEI